MSDNKFSIENNPFALLAVSTQNDQHEIMEAAEERSLLHDANQCQTARTVLTNPRRRFEAEIGWFPGVAPNHASRALSARTVQEIKSLPLSGLPLINGMLNAIQYDDLRTPQDSAEAIQIIMEASERVSLEDIIRDINYDRKIAGFPPYLSDSGAEDALREQRLLWRRGLLNTLEQRDTAEMVESIHILVLALKDAGPLPHLLDEFLEDYSLRAQSFMASEITSAEQLVEKGKSVAGISPDALVPIINSLGELLETWEELAKPMQISATVQGKRHEESFTIAYVVRDLAIDICNHNGLYPQAIEILNIIRETFSSIPQIMSKIEDDITQIQSLDEQHSKQNAEMFYAADIGAIFKSRLAITPDALHWEGKSYPLSTITGIRWGAINKSTNGIPTGTDYLISWTDGLLQATVKFHKGVIYNEFIKRALIGLGERLLKQLLDDLKANNELHYGSLIIRDRSVVLTREKWISSEQLEFPWTSVTVKSVSGALVIEGPPGSKAAGSVTYRDNYNIYFLSLILEKAVEMRSAQLSTVFN